MAKVVKVTVDLSIQQIEAIRRRVASGSSKSVSGFVQHAVQLALQQSDSFQALIAQALEETGGPLTKKEVNWVDDLLANVKPKKSRKGRRAA